MSDYTATKPATLPDYPAAKRGKVTRKAVGVTKFTSCPKCGRWTYITATDDSRAPYDRLGCFWTACEYRGER